MFQQMGLLYWNKRSLTYTPYYMSIDDISLDFGPNCVEPTTIVASEITTNSANISWTTSVSAPASYHVLLNN